MRFLFFFLFYLIPSLHQQVFSIENNGLIYEVLDKHRVNATFISSTKIGFGSSDNILKVYDVEGNHVWSFNTKNSIFDSQTTSDGGKIIVASEDRYLYMLDEFGHQLWKFRASRSMKKAAISEDGLMVAVVSDNLNLYVLDKDGNLLWEKNIYIAMNGLSIYGTGNNTRIVLGTDSGNIIIFDRKGNTLIKIDTEYAVTDLDITSNGGKIISGTFDNNIKLIHGGNGNLLWNKFESSPITSVSISENGKYILIGTKSGDVALLKEDGIELFRIQNPSPILDVFIESNADKFSYCTKNGLSRIYHTKTTLNYLKDLKSKNILILIFSIIIFFISIVFLIILLKNTEIGILIINKIYYSISITSYEVWKSRVSYTFILPTLILLLVFKYYPALSGLFHAFTEWYPGVKTEWVGLENFYYLWTDQYFWTGFINMIILVTTGILKIITIPLIVAELIFHLQNVIMKYWFRTFFIIPIVLPGVVLFLLWNNIYDPSIGLLNQTLNLIGLEEWTRVWYGDSKIALLSVIFIGFPWVDPFALLVFYGGLISISNEIFDAAKVDGAGIIHRFFKIDIPLLFGQFKLLFILTFIEMVQAFEIVFLTTGGGPGSATYTPALELYFMATRLNNLGVASAIGIILFTIILVITIINLRYKRFET